MDRESRRVGLKWKIAGIYTGVMLILAILVTVGIYQVTQNTLRAQLDRHALAIATNLTDAAAGHMAGKNLLALNALASKYTLHDGVAYTFIQNSRGEILAQTLSKIVEAKSWPKPWEVFLQNSGKVCLLLDNGKSTVESCH